MQMIKVQSVECNDNIKSTSKCKWRFHGEQYSKKVISHVTSTMQLPSATIMCTADWLRLSSYLRPALRKELYPVSGPVFLQNNRQWITYRTQQYQP